MKINFIESNEKIDMIVHRFVCCSLWALDLSAFLQGYDLTLPGYKVKWCPLCLSALACHLVAVHSKQMFPRCFL